MSKSLKNKIDLVADIILMAILALIIGITTWTHAFPRQVEPHPSNEITLIPQKSIDN